MVSAYFCIADAKVCPVRARFLGSHVPVNDSVSSLDAFVLHGVRQQGSTPYHIMLRSRKITAFMSEFRRAGGAAVLDIDGASVDNACTPPSLLHSK